MKKRKKFDQNKKIILTIQNYKRNLCKSPNKNTANKKNLKF